MSTSNSSDAGFTGLEAAIVLIAFVIVAAVFSFVVLQAGFLSAQQGQSVIHDGIGQAGSSCTVTGIVYGIGATPNRIDAIVIPIGLTAGSKPIDITTVSIRLVGSGHRETVAQNVPLVDVFPKSGFWSVQQRLNGDSDMILEAGEQFVLNISPSNLNDCKPYRSFAIEIKPAGRAALRVERTVPGSIERVTRLD
ncbi:flagellin [Methanoculleus sp. Wushi-C6]|uniref:Flagellin n=1 Tax=Methanoculleus caldifontis TaxID=2651577 RepID=A0ABU3X224_9EURY|nr:archaellin/type IV pilin N-terminal domain-containing protein [Methanoculleus sp. Wushi-C6]MDV2482112.1 flagellin [Methanoculleus sp. Wushi-C6]